ncbi:MAG: hypothetical protein XD57_1284 [Thermotoga petrophila]|uniref:Glycosyl transferase family 1 domain-containing protein n=1 Tax=Thermotoga petrophila TaxID=93929 RepID=A0A124FFU7_9THEM|nr:MAG: hypothetical protein XD57_1284 [Thermotoga petrophila]MBC7122200.1 glycosyltransferase [Pseudothermotoga sp.]
MKILLITNAPFLSAGNQSLRRTIQGLKELGVDIEIWMLEREVPSDISNEYEVKVFQSLAFKLLRRFVKAAVRCFRKVLRGTNKRKKSSVVFPPVTVELPLTNDKNCIEWVLHLPIVILNSLKLTIYSFINWKTLRNFDAVWGYERMGIIPALLLSRIFKKPLITSFQGVVLYDYLRRYGKCGTLLRIPLDFFSAKVRADLVVITDDGTRGLEVFEKLGHKRENVLFVPNGICRKELEAILTNNQDWENLNVRGKDELVFVIAKRLSKSSRIERAVFLANELIKRGMDDFKLFIIGDGEEYNKLKTFAEMNNLQGNVIFLGALPYQETLKYIQCCDMLWAFHDFSNLTNSVQDALTLGKYVLTLDDGSLEGFLRLSPAVDRNKILRVSLENFPVDAVEKIMQWKQKYNIQSECVESIPEEIWTWEKRVQTIHESLKRTLSQK